MIIANKTQNETVVKEISAYILKREQCETSEHFWGDNWLQICDEDLYQFIDVIFTIANEYHYTSADEIKTKVIDEIYNIIERHNQKNSTMETLIYTNDLSFIDMMKIYNTYATLPISIQRKAKIKHNRI